MMDAHDAAQAVFRWIHIVAGITWIGLLYFFNWVNGPFQGKIDAATKKVVNPELQPRALYFFRWGAAWTWITGVLLAYLVFYHGKLVLDDPFHPWTAGAILMILVAFLAFLVYDPVANSVKDNKTMAGVGFVLTAIVVFCFIWVGGFSYRGFQIHTGAMFGTLMAANVWMRIWPSQQKILTATKAGTPPDPAVVALAGTRSRHNTYMSVPLVWTMINNHTTSWAFSPVGSAIQLLVVIAIGWGAVNLLYKKAATVSGW
jgi:uncharacterized membrane protein